MTAYRQHHRQRQHIWWLAYLKCVIFFLLNRKRSKNAGKVIKCSSSFFFLTLRRQSAELRKFLITIWRTFICSVCWYVHCTSTVYFVVLSSRAAVWLKSRLRIFLIRVRLEERKKIRLDMSILIHQYFHEFCCPNFFAFLCAKKFKLQFEIVLKKNSVFSKF